jgi:hypothetical protein
MKYRIAVIAIAVCLSVPLLGCAPPPIEVELPSHSISYQGKYLKGDEGRIRILQMEPIDMTAYPHLKLRDGFTLQRAICLRQGGDLQGYVVAIYDASHTGFALELVDGVQDAQGGFLFAPIESADQAREYVEFMVHETPVSIYDREHQSIYTQAEFEEALSQLGGANATTLEAPPTQVTGVSDIGDGAYMVELVYKCELYRMRLEYLGCVVLRDGTLDLRERSVFIEGGPGAML